MSSVYVSASRQPYFVHIIKFAAHQEALKREIERLRQVYEQQNLKNMENKATQSHSSSSIVDASKLPVDKDQQPLNVSS